VNGQPRGSEGPRGHEGSIHMGNEDSLVQLQRDVQAAHRRRTKEALAKERTLDATVTAAGDSLNVANAICDEFDRAKPIRVACRKGCNWCCHQKVGITGAEAFRIAWYLKDHLDGVGFQEVQDRVALADDQTRGLDRFARMDLKYPCPLLREGACMVHPVRPLNCSGMTSLDADECRKAVADDLTRRHIAEGGKTIPVHGGRLAVHLAVAEGQLAGLTDSGFYGRWVELNQALRIVFERNTAIERWLAGKPVFAAAAIKEELEPLAFGEER